MLLKTLIPVFTALLCFSACATGPTQEQKVLARTVTRTGTEGTCSGTKSCSACKNCKYCKHCSKDGGTCGVCK